MKRKRQGRGKAIHKKDFDREAISKCPKQYREGRKCKQCGHTLTFYNEGPNCMSYCGTEIERYA